jgi:uncharacterized protein (TIGR02246 family)
MKIEKPVDIHAAVTTAFNAGDLDGLMALYEGDARMVGMDGAVLEGTAAIRANWEALLSFKGQMSLTTRYAIEMGDIALLSNDYTVAVGGDSLSGATAEVVRRQPDGGWLYIIDHPTGAGDPPEMPAE